MNKKDKGAIHKLFALIALLWLVICWSAFLQIMKAGYVSGYLEDCLTQANLAALLVDPYHYGSTGELVFEDVEDTRSIFKETLEAGLGSMENRERLGITEAVRVVDFRVYEVTSLGIMEFAFDENGVYQTRQFESSHEVEAPDGTIIRSSALYARIEVPVAFLFGANVMAVKEHCVDVVSKEMKNE